MLPPEERDVALLAAVCVADALDSSDDKGGASALVGTTANMV